MDPVARRLIILIKMLKEFFSSHSSKKDVLWICLIGLIINFTFLAVHPLWNRDDSRYAEMGSEMVATGDWVVPRLYYVPYLEKPVLTTYLVASSLWVFGINEFGARFWIGVLSIATAVMTYFLALRMYSRKVSFLSALILLTSGEYMVLSRFLTTDMVLTFFITLCYYFAFRYFIDRDEGGEKIHRPRWGILLSAGLAFTVLTKGFVGLVVILFPLSLYVAFTRDLSPVKRFPYIRAFLVFVLVLAPWHIAIYFKAPQFFEYFYYTNNIKAFFDKRIHHTAPWYSVSLFILGGFLPWSLFGIFAFLRKYREFVDRKKPQFILIAWLGGSFFFFSLSSAKMVTYVLPLFPLLAILTASLFEEELELKKWEKVTTLLLWSLLVMGGVGFQLVFHYYVAPDQEIPLDGNFYIFCSLFVFFVLLGTLNGGYSLIKGNSEKGILYFLFFFCLSLLPLGYSGKYLSVIRSSKEMVEALKGILKKGDQVYIFHDRDYAAFFYFEQRLPHIGVLAEVAQGAQWEPNPQYFLNYNDIPRLLKSKNRVFIISPHKDFVEKFALWHLFRVKASLKDSLNQGKMPQKIFEELGISGVPFSKKNRVEVVKKDLKWKISDEKNRGVIKMEKGRLNVYYERFLASTYHVVLHKGCYWAVSNRK